MLISLLINVIHKKNICKELLSRAHILPANYLNFNMDSDNILSEIMNNVKLSINEKSKSLQGYIETTNYVVGKDNKLETKISNFLKINKLINYFQQFLA